MGEGDCCWDVGGEKAAAVVGSDDCDCGWAIVAWVWVPQRFWSKASGRKKTITGAKRRDRIV